MCVCFRSWSGLYCVSKGGQSDAGGSSVGGALLFHAAAAGSGQSGERPTLCGANMEEGQSVICQHTPRLVAGVKHIRGAILKNPSLQLLCVFPVCWSGGFCDRHPGPVPWKAPPSLQKGDRCGHMLLIVLRYRPLHGDAGLHI